METNAKTMYLCLHALQVIPVSCINRDDTGTPKTCIYGGSSRMRVSSQCWKRAIRMYLREKYGDTGVRTKFISRILSERLVEETKYNEKEVTNFVKKWLGQAGIISSKEDGKNTSAFFSNGQINSLYDLLLKRFRDEKEAEQNINEGKDEKKLDSDKKFTGGLANAIMDKPTVSELLFGRMFAGKPSLNYDAACQVAHSFSVNEVFEEPDYFTVVGDIKYEENLGGSDFLETKLFNSGVLYRFADVNLSEGTELRNEHYKIDAAKTVCQFIEAFTLSMPTGSANAYANMTLPEIVVVELRDDIPVSFAPAFVQAIEGKDICKEAIQEMERYEEKISRLYGSPVKKWVLGEVSLNELCRQVEKEINRRL